MEETVTMEMTIIPAMFRWCFGFHNVLHRLQRHIHKHKENNVLLIFTICLADSWQILRNGATVVLISKAIARWKQQLRNKSTLEKKRTTSFLSSAGFKHWAGKLRHYCLAPKRCINTACWKKKSSLLCLIPLHSLATGWWVQCSVNLWVKCIIKTEDRVAIFSSLPSGFVSDCKWWSGLRKKGGGCCWWQGWSKEHSFTRYCSTTNGYKVCVCVGVCVSHFIFALGPLSQWL